MSCLKVFFLLSYTAHFFYYTELLQQHSTHNTPLTTKTFVVFQNMVAMKISNKIFLSKSALY